MLFQFLLFFINTLSQVLFWAIILRALLSFFPMRPGNPFLPLAVILHQITEPILAPLRKVIPSIGMFDISPMVALILIQVITSVLTTALISAARAL